MIVNNILHFVMFGLDPDIHIKQSRNCIKFSGFPISRDDIPAPIMLTSRNYQGCSKSKLRFDIRNSTSPNFITIWILIYKQGDCMIIQLFVFTIFSYTYTVILVLDTGIHIIQSTILIIKYILIWIIIYEKSECMKREKSFYWEYFLL